MDERRVNMHMRASLYAGLGGQIRHALKRIDEFRAAIRIAGVIDCINADEDVRTRKDFRPSQRERKKNGVSRGHIRDWDAIGHTGFRNVDITGQRRSAEQSQVNGDDQMSCCAVAGCNFGSSLQFNTMPLAVIKTERVTLEALTTRKRETRCG